MPDNDNDLKVEITVIDPPSGPRPEIKWKVHERGPGDPPDTFLSYADLAATEEADTYRTRHVRDYSPPNHRGYTCLDVLQVLWGKPWDAAALNVVHTLRPSGIRVVRRGDAVTLDARTWRVTVSLEDDDRTIASIEQEVEVGLRGCRWGSDVSAYLNNRLEPDGSGNEVKAYFNVASVQRLELCDGTKTPTEEGEP